ncbi:MAG: hypothetical protein R3213_12675 [Flavobacteriaceae bacterium]|nr:hypothetical protein [Flavobacteriaceae bacterium]
MKKLALCLLSLFMLQMNAQNKSEDRKEIKRPRSESKMQMTPEETASLQSKRMTLQLDLNDNQQAKVKDLLLEEAQIRQSMREEHKKFIEENKSNQGENTELRKEKRLEMMNARLDRQIKMKAKIKEILNPVQYEKWEANYLRNSKRKPNGQRKRKMTH